MNSTDNYPADGSLSVSDRLTSMDAKLDLLLKQSLPIRVRALEIVVYGICAVALLGVGNAMLSVVIP